MIWIVLHLSTQTFKYLFKFEVSEQHFISFSLYPCLILSVDVGWIIVKMGDICMTNSSFLQYDGKCVQKWQP